MNRDMFISIIATVVNFEELLKATGGHYENVAYDIQ